VYKMTGSGNDFLFVDGRVNPVAEWTADLIDELCDRRTGLGADGFAVVEPGSGAGRVRFHFFNRDGSPAPMCGNGALCATRIARWLELVQSDQMVLETGAGEVHTRALDGEAQQSELTMNVIPEVTQLEIDFLAGERSISFTTVGVPHVVVLVDDLASVPLMNRGRELRSHPAVGPAGSNVNFVARSPDASWAMRTYERGVEAETLACGTGAAACATVLAGAQEISLPWNVSTASGCVLTIKAQLSEQGQLRNPSVTGEGRLVYRAVVA
jgi:diaminopimelate epimerase